MSKTFFHPLAQAEPSRSSPRATACAGRRASRAASSPARRSRKRSRRRARSKHAASDATLDLLGESVTSLTEADAATRGYLGVIDAIIESGIERNISLKLTQLGLDVDRATLRRQPAQDSRARRPAGFFVRIDMENSPYTDVTLDIFETLWEHGYRNSASCCSRLRSDAQDPARMNALGARIRLVKGAYKEPQNGRVSAKERRRRRVRADDEGAADRGHLSGDRDARSGDDRVAREWARTHSITPDRFEFQMLYGIRRDLQTKLTEPGTGCASTSRSAANGSRTSCGGWANDRRTSGL